MSLLSAKSYRIKLSPRQSAAISASTSWSTSALRCSPLSCVQAKHHSYIRPSSALRRVRRQLLSNLDSTNARHQQLLLHATAGYRGAGPSMR